MADYLARHASVMNIPVDMNMESRKEVLELRLVPRR